MLQNSLYVWITLAASVQGLEFCPKSPNSESNLIWYKASDEEEVDNWKNEIDNFLKPYLDPNATGAENRVDCDYDNPPEKGKVCNVDVDRWKPCTSRNQYNYHKLAPCIFLKPNDIINWTPETYNKTLPKNMPSDLKNYINNFRDHSYMVDSVWVSCEGENPADVENIGAIQYIPIRGFPAYFFPFTHTEGYLSPLVAIFFERPKIGVLINIECKAWAKNIHRDRHDQIGSTHFMLMID